MDPLSMLFSLVSLIKPLVKYLLIAYVILLPFAWIGMCYYDIDLEKGMIFNIILVFTGLNPIFLFLFFKWILKKTFSKSFLFIFLILLFYWGIIYGLNEVILFSEHDKYLIIGTICTAIDLGITIIVIHKLINHQR